MSPGTPVRTLGPEGPAVSALTHGNSGLGHGTRRCVDDGDALTLAAAEPPEVLWPELEPLLPAPSPFSDASA